MTTLCDDCQAIGLPIMPVRYAVVPAAMSPALPAWASGQRVTDVALGSDFRYALRTLRAGYVYLFYSKNQWGSNKWECYMVTADGVLVKQPNPLMAAPQPTATLQCASHGQSNIRLHALVIERPDKCGPTWIAFSAHKWSEQTINEYATNSKLRNARMQTIHPAEMATGAKHSHGTPASAAALEEVIEYAAGSPASILPHDFVIGAFSRPDGTYEADWLKKVSTIHPWSLRQGQAAAGFAAMQMRAKKSDGGQNTPQVLALWDALGIAHELNGFRNDAAGWMDLYGREREFELNAANTIDGLKDALANRAGDQQKVEQDERMQYAASWYVPQEAAQQRANAQKLPEPGRTHQLEVCDIIDNWAKRDVPTLGFQQRLHSANTLSEPARSKQIGNVKADVDRFTQSRAKNYNQNIEHARATAWPKYQARLNRNLLDPFQKANKKLAAQVDAIVDTRTQAIVAWLEAPLLVDALEDFHPTNIADGVRFEDAVSAVSFGIGNTVRGAKKIDEWVEQAKASVKSNLLWRTIALNQQEGIDALDAALNEAKQHRAAQTLASAITWTGYTAKVMKGLADTYKKAQGVYDANLKATSEAGSTAFGARIGAVNMRGFDALAIGYGDRIFRAFALDKLGDYASEKIIQHIFTVRSLIDPLDSERLITEQAKLEQVGREQLLRRLQATKALMKLDTKEIRTAQTEALKKAWEDFRGSADRVKVGQAVKDVRLAVVVGLVEGVNFTKLLVDCKMKGDAKSYFSLLASGMSITSALFDVAATITKNLPAKPSSGLPGLGNESWTYQVLKGWGGVLR
jgi:hypothetical protein